MAPSRPKSSEEMKRITGSVKVLEDDGKCRKSIFMAKRKPALKKKAQELATLCDVPVLMACLGPDGKVDTWLDNQTEVKQILIKYQELNENEKTKRKLKSSASFESKKANLEEKIIEAVKNKQDINAPGSFESTLLEVNIEEKTDIMMECYEGIKKSYFFEIKKVNLEEKTDAGKGLLGFWETNKRKLGENIEISDDQLDGFSREKLIDFLNFLDAKLKVMDERICKLKNADWAGDQ